MTKSLNNLKVVINKDLAVLQCQSHGVSGVKTKTEALSDNVRLYFHISPAMIFSVNKRVDIGTYSSQQYLR